LGVKNLSFQRRLGFAVNGLITTLRSEHSFRFHVLSVAAVLGVLLWRRPAALWWAAMIVTMMIVLAAELINTAVEHLADHLHPDHHPSIKVVKDCAAAAVLVASIGALGVAAAFVWDQWR
jgi:diacylglycerol kinase (ATP)